MMLHEAENQLSPDYERAIREAALDETIEATFPASDPPSSIPNPADETALERQHHEGDSGSEPFTTSRGGGT